MRLIDADALYERLKADEELARNRVIDTPSSFPNGAVNPSAIRYMAQLSERTRFKEIVFDAPTIERKKGKWIPVTRIYKVTEGQFPQTHIEWVDATEPDEIDGVRCSECGTVYDFIEARNWCSECGADMRGGEQE